jgi:hypothetical protein
MAEGLKSGSVIDIAKVQKLSQLANAGNETAASVAALGEVRRNLDGT